MGIPLVVYIYIYIYIKYAYLVTYSWSRFFWETREGEKGGV